MWDEGSSKELFLVSRKHFEMNVRHESCTRWDGWGKQFRVQNKSDSSNILAQGKRMRKKRLRIGKGATTEMGMLCINGMTAAARGGLWLLAYRDGLREDPSIIIAVVGSESCLLNNSSTPLPLHPCTGSPQCKLTALTVRASRSLPRSRTTRVPRCPPRACRRSG